MHIEGETIAANRTASLAARLRGLCKLIRPHQWVKNLLLVLPALLAHKLFTGDIWEQVAWAFVSLSLSASAVYILNDRMDYLADREHPKKKQRGFASSLVPLSWAPVTVAILSISGSLIAWFFLPILFLYGLLFYLFVTTLYTFWLKRLVIVDVLVLGGLYTLRIIIGGLATNITVSTWLLAFSMFVFSSMAFGKRYSELLSNQKIATEDDASLKRRGYHVKDLALVQTLGICTGMMSVVVLSLYVELGSLESKGYENPQALGGVCIAVFYWICNFWLLATRGRMNEDIVKFVFLDWSTLVGAVIVLACSIIAIWPFG
jgi:4-hydroxybenzoate polyprenyltransferase